MEYTIEEIPYLSKEQKRDMVNYLEYKKNKCNKYFFWSIVVIFCLTGMVGWLSAFLVFYVNNSFQIIFYVCGILFSQIISYHTGYDYSYKGIAASIVFQAICISLILAQPFAQLLIVFPLVNIFLYIKRYR